MPVIPTSQQVDAWYALSPEDHNRLTLDQFIGNTGGGSAAPVFDGSQTSEGAGGFSGHGQDPNAWKYETVDPGAGRQKVQPVPAYTPSYDPWAAQRAAYNPNAPAAGAGSPTLPASWGGPIAPGQTPPPSYDQHIVYTDPSGRGYTPEQLKAALSNVAFMADPLNARARDIVPQYSVDVGGSSPVHYGDPVAAAVAGGAAGGGASGRAPVNTSTPYRNSSQSLLVNAAMQRLSQLQTPIDRTSEDAYTKMALDRVSQLSGPPFTDTQNAALLTQHMQPLTQARDTAKQQAAEELSRRGIIPSSGVFQDRMKAIDQAYERGVAGVTNTLNIQGIDATQKNAALQLQILDSLVNMGRMSRQEADQRSQEIVQTAGIPFNTDLQTLSALTSASGGDNASSLISSLLGIGNLNQRGSEFATQQNGQDAAAYGQVIGYIMAHHAEFGF